MPPLPRFLEQQHIGATPEIPYTKLLLENSESRFPSRERFHTSGDGRFQFQIQQLQDCDLGL